MGPVREECGRRVEAEDNDRDDDDVEEPAEEEEEEPDPRIQTELEKLNRATDAINSMETELEVCFGFYLVLELLITPPKLRYIGVIPWSLENK